MHGLNSAFRFAVLEQDADRLIVRCAGGGASDDDDEDHAGFTDVEFTIGPAPVGVQYLVQCYHEAQFRGVTYPATSTGVIAMT